MSRAKTTLPEIRTLADLLKRLGDIPSDRVRFPPVTATEDDLTAVQARREGLFKRVDDRIVEKAVGTWGRKSVSVSMTRGVIQGGEASRRSTRPRAPSVPARIACAPRSSRLANREG